MGAVFCFLLFLAAVGLCILLGQSLILAIWVGIAAFAALGLRRGMTVRAMWDAAWAQGRKMCCVIVIYMLIGAITALWRSAGTIAFFIYHGLRIITPQLFLLVTFLLTSFISYALGTSFGVVGTLGVILMALARSGGVSVAITAGTIVAGAYFGDRCSPASSSATLVAAATDTNLYDNLHMMHRTGWLPYLVSLAAYAAPVRNAPAGHGGQRCAGPAVRHLQPQLVDGHPGAADPDPAAVQGPHPAHHGRQCADGAAGDGVRPGPRSAAHPAGCGAGLPPRPRRAARRALRRRHDVHGLGHHHGRQRRAVRRAAGRHGRAERRRRIWPSAWPGEPGGSPPARRSPWCAVWCSATSPPARWCATICWRTTTPSAATAGARWPLTSRTPASSSRR